MVTPFKNIVAQKLVSEPVFSYYLNRDQTTSPGGEIIFGGVDKNLIKGDITYTTATSANKWQFRIDGISIEERHGKAYGKTVCKGGCQATIDTFYPLITGTAAEVAKLNENIGALPLTDGSYQFPSCCVGWATCPT